MSGLICGQTENTLNEMQHPKRDADVERKGGDEQMEEEGLAQRLSSVHLNHASPSEAEHRPGADFGCNVFTTETSAESLISVTRCEAGATDDRLRSASLSANEEMQDEESLSSERQTERRKKIQVSSGSGKTSDVAGVSEERSGEKSVQASEPKPNMAPIRKEAVADLLALPPETDTRKRGRCTAAGEEDRGSYDGASEERDQLEQEQEGGSAVVAAAGSSSVKAVGKRRRQKQKKQRDKATTATLRSTMIMGETYTGVISCLPPDTNSCSVRIEGTRLEGFANIPDGTICTLRQTVSVQMALPNPRCPHAKSLRLELV